MNLFGNCGNDSGSNLWIWILIIIVLVLCADGNILGSGNNNNSCCEKPCIPPSCEPECC